MNKKVIVDCEAGRRLHCSTFCCRLIVRLGPGEVDPEQPENKAKHCIDKNPEDGICVYLDRDSMRCRIWEKRPAVCRAYDCNQDPLLQVVLSDGFHSLTRLVKSKPPPREAWVRIPSIETENHQDKG